MSQVFVVVLNDRHTDTEVRVFESLERANTCAKKCAESYRNGGYEFEDKYSDEGFYHASMSEEGDHMFVTTCEFNQD
jgi:hypothetical protein